MGRRKIDDLSSDINTTSFVFGIMCGDGEKPYITTVLLQHKRPPPPLLYFENSIAPAQLLFVTIPEEGFGSEQPLL